MPSDRPFKLVQVDEVRWKIPRTGGMRVPGLIYTDTTTLPDIEKDQSAEQVYNVAHLPGIIGHSLAMPDVHWGYGFPIGGVAAFDLEEGVVSPGGVGYDINCGVRLALTGMDRETIFPRIRKVIDFLFVKIPSGLGSRGGIHLNKNEMSKMLKLGAAWAVRQGMGEESDLERIEERGALDGADPSVVSDRAFERGKDQLGTLGSGNHFLEIGFIEQIFDEKTAAEWGIFKGQVTVMVHSGSRGFGYQVCDEFLARMVKSVREERIELPDRQLACTRLNTSLAREYLAAMACAANFAFANRQILMHLAKTTWEEAIGISPRELKFRLLYDVCHNIAKFETHDVNGKQKKVIVHRKGATRSFPANHPALPAIYRHTGQPVLIPGDMGRASYVLAGEEGAMKETFGSACHGAGRILSRHEALRQTKGRSIERELQDENVYPRWVGRKTLREEFPEAYKDVSLVVDVVQRAGLARKVAKIHPMGVVKG
ncbi:MAG: RtcB family protein [Desulfomonile tiedjei]|uniref:tRNA-splicing ligase RtcB n=1 Tax=Desulfomonile tiedjei TaxID=2358 RepID=A0A9D6V5N0_9BACT|nr:RtcB family protein [Desulfomonile tiedjei]